jgi:hypothetical protein
MQDSTSWKAIQFLETLKKKIRGFAFSVFFDSQGLPDAFMYMTLQMRMNLVQYGNVIFLDVQQRQFNSSGFPYISPVLHDAEGKIAQGAESIPGCFARWQGLSNNLVWTKFGLRVVNPHDLSSEVQLLASHE